ncbi:MAG: GAF domain-containing protein [Candidatus Omnitrophica bacterium]|nr:GAF domain-containing protein [Candidatus Omnitrophota bacterium]
MNDKSELYAQTLKSIERLIDGENDLIAVMATAVCELHHAFDYFDWTGFYRVAAPGLLKIGPYQGGHGCLRISFDRGVCGAAARTQTTQIVSDVRNFPGHIACSSTTRSEIVAPVFDSKKNLIAVLDVDSDSLNAFDAADQENLEKLCRIIGERV